MGSNAFDGSPFGFETDKSERIGESDFDAPVSMTIGSWLLSVLLLTKLQVGSTIAVRMDIISL